MSIEQFLPDPNRLLRQDFYQCHCVIFMSDGPGTNHCTNDTGSPDRPFCDKCEARHPALQFLGLVGTRPLNQRERHERATGND